MNTHFSKTVLKDRLAGLSYRGQLLFALSCSERMYPNYVFFHNKYQWGDPEILRYALDSAWSHLEFNIDIKGIEALIDKCDSVAPDTENFNTIYVSSALDAAVSVVSLLEYIKGLNIQMIIDIAVLARDTVDMYFGWNDWGKFKDPMTEEQIANHPMMQKELAQQIHDLDILKNISAFDEKEISNFKSKFKGQTVSNIGLRINN